MDLYIDTIYLWYNAAYFTKYFHSYQTWQNLISEALKNDFDSVSSTQEKWSEKLMRLIYSTLLDLGGHLKTMWTHSRGLFSSFRSCRTYFDNLKTNKDYLRLFKTILDYLGPYLNLLWSIKIFSIFYNFQSVYHSFYPFPSTWSMKTPQPDFSWEKRYNTYKERLKKLVKWDLGPLLLVIFLTTGEPSILLTEIVRNSRLREASRLYYKSREILHALLQSRESPTSFRMIGKQPYV